MSLAKAKEKGTQPMYRMDNRAVHLAWVEAALRRKNSDLPELRFTVQSHYGPPECIAFVVVDGIDWDRTRRRQIRTDASDLLRRLGYSVELEPGRDVYDVTPARPASAHDELQMLQHLQAATGGTDG
jgi:hypothetical protein